MNIMAHGAQPLTMSSREIADLVEKQHKHVMRDIKVMLDQIGMDEAGYAQVWTNPQNGQDYPEYRLPKDLTVTLITGYRADLRYRVVKRLEELEAAPAAADPAAIFENPAAMRGLLLTYADKVIALEAKNDAMREDVEAHERLVKADGSLSITEAAKNLAMRPKDLFMWLSHNGWIYKRTGSPNWLGYQTKCNTGLLEHKSTTVLRADGSEKITEQVRVTAKGLSALARLVRPTATLV